jgi:hypothetical protein
MIECCHRDWERLDMGSERKLFLLVVSFVFVLFLLNAGSAAKPITEANSPLASGQTTHYYPSNGITQFGTTIQLAGTLGLNDWYTSNVTVTLTVQSSVSGVTTAYSYDNIIWHSYTGPFNISAEGYTTLYYNSTYPNGPVEDTNMMTVKIDKTPPDVTLETQILPGIGVNVTIKATDTVSPYTVSMRVDEGKLVRYAPILFTTEGIHSLYYRATDEAGNFVEGLDYFDVVILPAVAGTELSYTGDTMGVYSDPVTLEAILTESLTGLPVAGKSIEFTVGTQTATALTDTEGLASATLVLDQPEGTYTVSASFAGDDEYLSSSDSSDFHLSKESSFVLYSGLTVIQKSDSTLTLMATIFDDADGYWGELTRINVTFTIYLLSDPTTPVQVIGPVGVSNTGFDGVGIAAIEIPNLPEDEYLIVVSLDPGQNHYYWSLDSEAAVLTIYKPGRESASGFGWINDGDGHKGQFVFSVKYSCRGGLDGFVYYTVRIGDVVYFVRSTDITGFTVYDNHAFFEASVTIYMYNLTTREKVKLEDGYRVRVDAWASMKRHGKDIFQIQVFDKYGIVVYETGAGPLGHVHKGNIVIQGYCHHHHHHHYYHKHYWYHRCHCHKMKHW